MYRSIQTWAIAVLLLSASTTAWGTPTDISGLYAWWKADSITGLSDGQAINASSLPAGWVDSSNNALGLNLVMTTGALNGGAYSASGFNGQPGVTMTNGSSLAASSSLRTSSSFGITGNPAYTLFVALTFTGTGSPQEHPFLFGNAGSPAGALQGLEFEGSRLEIPAGFGADWATTATGPWTSPSLISVRKTSPGFTNVTTAVAVNGTGVGGSLATNVTLNLANGQAYVGFDSVLNARGMSGIVAEIIFYNRTLTNEEENAVGYYLEQKYGLNTQYVAPTPAPEPASLLLFGTASLALVRIGRCGRKN